MSIKKKEASTTRKKKRNSEMNQKNMNREKEKKSGERKSACGTYWAGGGLWPGRAANAIAILAVIGGQTSRTGGQRGGGGGLGHALRAVAVL